MKTKVKTNFNLLLVSIAILFIGPFVSCSDSDDDINIKIEKISLDVTELTITVEETKTINYSIIPENATVTDLAWISEDSEIVTVNNKGEVTGAKPGETDVTIKAGTKTASCKVTVVAKHMAVESITLNEQKLTVSEGDVFQLVATIHPENTTNKKVNWTSDNEDIAIVDGSGEVTTKAVGEAIITATTDDGEKEASCKVIVKPTKVTDVVLNVEELYLGLDASVTLQATIKPENASNKNVTWSSNNENVATVDNEGKVTAVGLGDAVITVTTEDGKMSAFCSVEVLKKVYRDDFNRDNTGYFDANNPKGIGEDWTITYGKHRINNQVLESVTKEGEINQSIILYTAEGSSTQSENDKFEVSFELNHGTFAGLIFNASQDGQSYYLLRINPQTNLVQFLATKNGGAGWQNIINFSIVKEISKNISYKTYRMTIRTEGSGEFIATFTDESGVIGEYHFMDTTAQDNNTYGYFGIWSQLDPKFDNFMLKMK